MLQLLGSWLDLMATYRRQQPSARLTPSTQALVGRCVDLAQRAIAPYLSQPIAPPSPSAATHTAASSPPARPEPGPTTSPGELKGAVTAASPDGASLTTPTLEVTAASLLILAGARELEGAAAARAMAAAVAAPQSGTLAPAWPWAFQWDEEKRAAGTVYSHVSIRHRTPCTCSLASASRPPWASVYASVRVR